MGKKIMKLVLVVSIIFLASVVITCKRGKVECDDNIGCLELEVGEPIKIAVLQPLSGRLKNSGTVQIRGIQLALEKRGNKILDHPIELVIEDSQCSPEGGANSALKIISDPEIVGIIGTNCSGAGAEASKIMSNAGLVMISGTNSAAVLTSTDGIANESWYPGYFRTMYNAIGRGEAGAIFTYKNLGIRKAATINDGDNRSIELVSKFEKVFTELGGEIVLSTAIDRQDQNMKPVLRSVELAGAQMVFYPFFPPETTFLTKQAREIEGLNNTAFMVCGSTMRSNEFINEVMEAGHGLYFLGKAPLTGEIFEGLKKDYENNYSDLHDDNLYAFAFDASNILFDAIEKTIIKDKKGNSIIKRQKLRDNMYATKNHNGATGILSSDPFGDCGTPQFNILQLKDYKLGISGLLENEVFYYNPKGEK